MRTLPPFLLLLLGLAVGGLLLPGASSAFAEEKDGPKAGGKGEDGKEEAEGEEEEGEGGGEFYEGETSFSGKQVGIAIDKGIQWLKKKQQSSGSWGAIRFNSTYGGGSNESQDGYPAGPTALALYTLLKCKAQMKDPAIRKGFDYLDQHFGHKPPTAYEASMMLLAVTATADSNKMTKSTSKMKERPKLTGKYATWATKLKDYLLDQRTLKGWRYSKESNPPGGNEDLSSTQLAALALFAAHRLGIKVKNDVWEDILQFSLAQQELDGDAVSYTDPVDPKKVRTAKARGFAYIRSHTEDAEESRSTGGMTACGLGGLEMARFVMTDGGDAAKREQWNKRSDAEKVQTALFDGIAWLEKNWSPFDDPHKGGKNNYTIYWLYALERAMDLLDLKLVGSHNWYNEMGQELLNRQLAEGHWDLLRGGTNGGGGHDVLDTCFALLFLKRATKGQIPFGSVTGGSELPPVDNR
jgi:hypothetical protein